MVQLQFPQCHVFMYVNPKCKEDTFLFKMGFYSNTLKSSSLFCDFCLHWIVNYLSHLRGCYVCFTLYIPLVFPNSLCGETKMHKDFSSVMLFDLPPPSVFLFFLFHLLLKEHHKSTEKLVELLRISTSKYKFWISCFKILWKLMRLWDPKVIS